MSNYDDHDLIIFSDEEEMDVGESGEQSKCRLKDQHQDRELTAKC